MLLNTGLQHADRAWEMALPYRIGIASVKEFFRDIVPTSPDLGATVKPIWLSSLIGASASRVAGSTAS